jgi:hypothetical protein
MTTGLRQMQAQLQGIEGDVAIHKSLSGHNRENRLPVTRTMSTDNLFAERHYRIGDLAELWSIGRETIRLIVKDEPGVIQIRCGRKKAHTTYSVPASVAERIHRRLAER